MPTVDDLQHLIKETLDHPALAFPTSRIPCSAYQELVGKIVERFQELLPAFTVKARNYKSLASSPRFTGRDTVIEFSTTIVKDGRAIYIPFSVEFSLEIAAHGLNDEVKRTAHAVALQVARHMTDGGFKERLEHAKKQAYLPRWFPVKSHTQPINDREVEMCLPSVIPWWLAQIAHEHWVAIGEKESIEGIAARGGWPRHVLLALLRQNTPHKETDV